MFVVGLDPVTYTNEKIGYFEKKIYLYLQNNHDTVLNFETSDSKSWSIRSTGMFGPPSSDTT